MWICRPKSDHISVFFPGAGKIYRIACMCHSKCISLSFPYASIQWGHPQTDIHYLWSHGELDSESLFLFPFSSAIQPPIPRRWIGLLFSCARFCATWRISAAYLCRIVSLWIKTLNFYKRTLWIFGIGKQKILRIHSGHMPNKLVDMHVSIKINTIALAWSLFALHNSIANYVPAY